jgi:hypothetical protein
MTARFQPQYPPPGPSRRNRIMLCLRTLLFFGAGVLVGAGLLLYGQVRFGLYIHDEVDNTFFLWRAIGEATYFLQSPETQLSLALHEIDKSYLLESRRVSITLMIIGALIAFITPWLQPLRRHKG